MSSIATNINAARAEHAMTDAAQQVDKSTLQLATGRRINSAADDTAGMAIGSKLSTESISLQRAMHNANDGVSMLQTADGVAGSMTDALTRMREIALQAANDTNSESDRSALDNEFTQLREHLGVAIDSAKWNGKKLLDGSTASVNLQIGASSGDGHAVDMADFRGLSALNAAGVSSQGDALSALDAIDSSLASIDEARVKWGANMNRLVHASDSSSNVALHLDDSRSKIIDADYAKATADLAKAQILQMAGKAMLSQANQVPISVLRLLR
jgi:flagellin